MPNMGVIFLGVGFLLEHIFLNSLETILELSLSNEASWMCQDDLFVFDKEREFDNMWINSARKVRTKS